MGGPAADNNELRALREALLTKGGMGTSTVTYIWPLLVAFGDARYQEGRQDAALQILEEHAARIARGVSVPEAP